METSDPKVGQGFSLVMQLEEPAKLMQLMLALKDEWDTLRGALAELDYVHYARFLPLWDHGLLLIVTEFDGDMEDYVTDFAAVVGPQFDMILSYMKGRPPPPVATHTAAFRAYVKANTRPRNLALPAYDQPFTAYPDKTVFEIIGGARRKKRFTAPASAFAPRHADFGDVQANVLRGYRAACVCHVMLRFGAAADAQARADSARAFLAALLDGAGEIGVDFDDRFGPDAAKRPRCVNLGFTPAGLAALGLPPETLKHLPLAFREGPEARAERVGDVGGTAPATWSVPPRDGARAAAVDLMVSVWAASDDELDRALLALSALIAEHGLEEVHHELGRALDDRSTIHFGYVDRSGQPHIAGVPTEGAPAKLDPQPSPVGDFLLGRGYVNARGGRYIGALPDALATNATYAALRVIEQDAGAFEKLLDTVADAHSLEDRVRRPPAGAAAQAQARAQLRETVAAKLMGRWRDGTPLVVAPDGPPAAPDVTNAFDYVAPPGPLDDLDGRVCPIGAHARRLHPRGGSVVGVPVGRRVIRRGMPYGPAWTPGETDKPPRGLLGLFFCGDLESQYEFLLAAWANGDIAAPGLRDTRDPFTGGWRATPMRMRLAPHLREIEITVPPLTRTVGSLYLFMPGRRGLQWLRDGMAERAVADEASTGGQAGEPVRAAERAKGGVGKPVPPRRASFDPASPVFRNDPDAAYRADRPHGIVEVGTPDRPYRGYWVLGAGLVEAVLADRERFPKPEGSTDPPDPSQGGAGLQPVLGATRSQRNGLFYLNGDDHRRVRRVVDPLMETMATQADAVAAQVIASLLPALHGRTDFVQGFAQPLPQHVFMQLFDLPRDAALLAAAAQTGDARAASGLADQRVVDQWARSMLAGNDRTAAPGERLAGATASLAMRAYFAAQLALRRVAPGAAPRLLDGLAARTCPVHGAFDGSAGQVHAEEAMNTAAHFALGGYLSTEFLIVNGMHLLLQYKQWERLRERREDASAVRAAIREMLRFAPPFQLADRWVAGEAGATVELGGHLLQAGRRLTLVYASANREGPGADPDRFDIDRYLEMDEPPPGHYGFGGSGDIHYCIGADMAMRVAQATFTALLDAFPAPQLDEVGPGRGDPYFRSRKSLFVNF